MIKSFKIQIQDHVKQWYCTTIVFPNEKGVPMETYYDPADLAMFSPNGVGEGAPELWEKYMAYYGAVFADGALTAREKALIALAVAAAVQCPYCIDSYTNALLNQGCDESEIIEAIHVANAIRGGASLAHGVRAKKIVDENDL